MGISHTSLSLVPLPTGIALKRWSITLWSLCIGFRVCIIIQIKFPVSLKTIIYYQALTLRLAGVSLLTWEPVNSNRFGNILEIFCTWDNAQNVNIVELKLYRSKSLVVRWLGLHASTAGVLVLILDFRTKLPQAAQ